MAISGKVGTGYPGLDRLQRGRFGSEEKNTRFWASWWGAIEKLRWGRGELKTGDAESGEPKTKKNVSKCVSAVVRVSQ